MIRLILITCAAFALFGGAALAHDHGQTSSHAHSVHGGSCCHQIHGQTAHVLIAPSGDAVRRIQAELAVKGYDPGPIDGILGPRTNAALRSFQRSEGMYEGLLTVETLARLGIRVSPAANVSRQHGHLHSGELQGASTVTVHRSEPTTVIRRIVRPATSELVGPGEAELPNYIGRGEQHLVAPLSWPGKTAPETQN